MRFFAAGLITETNTFCPIPTALTDFAIARGSDRDSCCNYPHLDLGKYWGRWAAQRGDTFTFSLMAFAQPSGVTVAAAYEALRGEILVDLRSSLPVDIVLLHLHGAMIADGYENCELDLIQRIRRIVGDDVVIGVELDLHCNFEPLVLDEVDLVVTYKEYPHVDVEECAKDLFGLAVDTCLGRIKPVIALFDCRTVGLFPTSREPMRGFVDRILELERSKYVLSISFVHGFQFGDVENVGAKVIVITDNDLPQAQKVADEIGEEFYRIREEASVASISLPLEAAMLRAIETEEFGVVVVADQSDNPGAGAPGDATYALRWLLDHQVDRVGIAFMYDPEVVRITKKGGVGSSCRVRLGGKLGLSSGSPIDLSVTVVHVIDDYRPIFPQKDGLPIFRRAGDTVAIRHDGIEIVVTSERCQCFSPSAFSDFGIDVKEKRLLVVKSTQHFYAGFAPLAREVLYMSAPGAVCPDPLVLSYGKLKTERVYPWCRNPLPKLR